MQSRLTIALKHRSRSLISLRSKRRSQHDPIKLYLDSVLGHFYQLITQMHSGYLLDSIKYKGNKGAKDAMDVMICNALSKIYVSTIRDGLVF